ncbi:hypothetical protein RDABS01_004429 [Bienertia sinuspersici]
MVKVSLMDLQTLLLKLGTRLAAWRGQVRLRTSQRIEAGIDKAAWQCQIYLSVEVSSILNGEVITSDNGNRELEINASGGKYNTSEQVENDLLFKAVGGNYKKGTS